MATAETSTTKDNYASRGTPLDRRGRLRDIINGSPHLVAGEVLTNDDEVGVMGIVVTDGVQVLGAVKHPRHIPRQIDLETHEVDYEGSQTDSHLEGSMQRVLGMDHVAARARRTIDTLKARGLVATSVQTTGLFQIGNESEMWVYDSNGDPYELPTELVVSEGARPLNLQEELHASLWETSSQRPNVRPADQAIDLAADMIRRHALLPDAVINNTSVPVASHPEKLLLNTDKKQNGKYVAGMQWQLYLEHFNPQDPIAKAGWDNYALSLGYRDFADMKIRVGSLALWTSAAGQASFGLRHYREANGSFYTATEEAIAVSDMFNSNLTTIADFMTFGTPIVCGQRVGIGTDAGMVYPLDQREAFVRRGLLTAYPADDFIRDPETLHQRLSHNMRDGVADRLDRASYSHTFQIGDQQLEVASAHGRVRNRMTAKGGLSEPYKALVGRVEYTGGGSTPDITATVSRNAFLQLMGIYAYEALAQGQYPMDYQDGQFPSMASCQNQIELSHAYNFLRDEGPGVRDLIAEAKSFVEYMQQNYQTKDMQNLCQVAIRGIERLTEETVATDLDEFLTDPRGRISDVISRMYERGDDPAIIAKKVHEFQLAQAQLLLSSDIKGDILKLFQTSHD